MFLMGNFDPQPPPKKFSFFCVLCLCSFSLVLVFLNFFFFFSFLLLSIVVLSFFYPFVGQSFLSSCRPVFFLYFYHFNFFFYLKKNPFFFFGLSVCLSIFFCLKLSILCMIFEFHDTKETKRVQIELY